jgi:hypothetical protein
MRTTAADESLFLFDAPAAASNLGFLRLVVVCYPQEIMTREAAEGCARSPKGKDTMRLLAQLIMGTQQNYWEWLACCAAWLAVQTALEEYDGQMLKMDELGGYC